MKKDIVEYVSRFPNCQKVKAEHLKPSGLTQMIEVLNWKWEVINIFSDVVLVPFWQLYINAVMNYFLHLNILLLDCCCELM